MDIHEFCIQSPKTDAGTKYCHSVKSFPVCLPGLHGAKQNPASGFSFLYFLYFIGQRSKLGESESYLWLWKDKSLVGWSATFWSVAHIARCCDDNTSALLCFLLRIGVIYNNMIIKI